MSEPSAPKQCCLQTQERAVSYIHGEDPKPQELEAFARDCKICARYLETVKATLAMTAILPSMEASKSVWKRIRKGLRETNPDGSPARGRALKWKITGLLTIALILAVTLKFMMPKDEPKILPPPDEKLDLKILSKSGMVFFSDKESGLPQSLDGRVDEALFGNYVLSDGSVLELAPKPKSNVKIFGPARIRLRKQDEFQLLAGYAEFRHDLENVRKTYLITPQAKAILETQSACVLVSDYETVLTVHKGRAEFMDAKGSHPVIMQSGQQSVVDLFGQPSQAVDFDPEVLARGKKIKPGIPVLSFSKPQQTAKKNEIIEVEILIRNDGENLLKFAPPKSIISRTKLLFSLHLASDLSTIKPYMELKRVRLAESEGIDITHDPIIIKRNKTLRLLADLELDWESLDFSKQYYIFVGYQTFITYVDNTWIKKLIQDVEPENGLKLEIMN